MSLLRIHKSIKSRLVDNIQEENQHGNTPPTSPKSNLSRSTSTKSTPRNIWPLRRASSWASDKKRAGSLKRAGLYDPEEVASRKCVNDKRECCVALTIAHKKLAKSMDKDLSIQMMLKDTANQLPGVPAAIRQTSQ